MSFVPRVEVCYSSESTTKWCISTVSTQTVYVSPLCDQGRTLILTKFDRGKTFRPSSTEEKHFDQVRPSKKISTTFDRGKTFQSRSTEEKHFDHVRTRKNISIKFDRGKTFRPSSTEEKVFDRVRPSSFFRLTRTSTVSTSKFTVRDL